MFYTQRIFTTDVDSGDSRYFNPLNILPEWLELIDNGDGTATLWGIPNSEQVGIDKILLQVADRGGLQGSQALRIEVKNQAQTIVLAEGNNFLTQNTMEIGLGAVTGARTLKFDLKTDFDSSDGDKLLLDRLNINLVDINNPSQKLKETGERNLFSFSETGAEYTPGLVRYDGKTVEIDLTDWGNLMEGLLQFQLLGNDSDTGSRVTVENLQIELDIHAVEQPVFPDKVEYAPIGGEIDTANLNPTDTVAVILDNFRFDEMTSRYTGTLVLKNNGGAIDRNLVVLFDNLPAELTLSNPSGYDGNGTPYLNLQDAVPSGGLTAGAISNPIEITFDNPNRIVPNLQATVLSGGANLAPEFPALDNLTVTPGAKLTLPLTATDANGDVVTFQIKSDNPLPTGSLDGSGQLVFAPKPEEVGTHSFTLIATDGVLETTQEVTLNVVADSLTTTRISGVIQNVGQQPLVGLSVEIGGVTVQTAADGSFFFEFTGELPSDTLKVHGEEIGGDAVYPFIAEKLPLLLGREVYGGVNNIIDRPIYLPALDVASGKVIDPDADETVTTVNIPGAAVFVGAGTLLNQQGNPFTGTLSITEVPIDLTPAALPPNLLPDLVVTIQPGEMVFTQPAPLSLPNRSGWASGTEMDLWSINPVTGDFDKVGTGKVSEDGSVVETIEGGIRNSSWHFFAVPPAGFIGAADPRNQDTKGNEKERCEDLSSSVKLHSGAVMETHDLVTYQSNGVTRGLTLTYDSLRADPRQVLSATYNYFDPFASAPNSIKYLRIASDVIIYDGNFSYREPSFNIRGLGGIQSYLGVPNTAGTYSVGLPQNLGTLPSGKYNYQLRSGIVINAPSRFIVGSSSSSNGQIINVNAIDSPFGSGWGLAGLMQIAENSDGSVLLIDGDGGEVVFERGVNGYIPPAGDFSVLEKLADGTFRRTLKDQTIYTFNSERFLSSTIELAIQLEQQESGAGRVPHYYS
jgi:hypothetical protein